MVYYKNKGTQMNSSKNINSKSIGLDFGLSIGRFFLNTEDLHYGYWPKDQTASIQNFVEAQNQHSQLIIDNIPKTTKSILDVGSGSGSLALKLLNLGYNVDCVIPSQFLAEQVKSKLSDQSTIHQCTFENVSETKKYDLILFSESFQYVKIKESLLKIKKILNPHGHILICDFFQRNNSTKSPMGGGHNWNQFNNYINEYPFKLKMNLDITAETAPTIDLFAKFNDDVLSPLVLNVDEYLKSKYPLITKFIKWKFHKRLEKISNIYLRGGVNGQSFTEHKQYHLLIYKN